MTAGQPDASSAQAASSDGRSSGRLSESSCQSPRSTAASEMATSSQGGSHFQSHELVHSYSREVVRLPPRAATPQAASCTLSSRTFDWTCSPSSHSLPRFSVLERMPVDECGTGSESRALSLLRPPHMHPHVLEPGPTCGPAQMTVHGSSAGATRLAAFFQDNIMTRSRPLASSGLRPPLATPSTSSNSTRHVPLRSYYNPARPARYCTAAEQQAARPMLDSMTIGLDSRQPFPPPARSQFGASPRVLSRRLLPPPGRTIVAIEASPRIVEAQIIEQPTCGATTRMATTKHTPEATLPPLDTSPAAQAEVVVQEADLEAEGARVTLDGTGEAEAAEAAKESASAATLRAIRLLEDEVGALRQQMNALVPRPPPPRMDSIASLRRPTPRRTIARSTSRWPTTSTSLIPHPPTAQLCQTHGSAIQGSEPPSWWPLPLSAVCGHNGLSEPPQRPVQPRTGDG